MKDPWNMLNEWLYFMQSMSKLIRMHSKNPNCHSRSMLFIDPIITHRDAREHDCQQTLNFMSATKMELILLDVNQGITNLLA